MGKQISASVREAILAPDLVAIKRDVGLLFTSRNIVIDLLELLPWYLFNSHGKEKNCSTGS